ncbi:MAG: hypothetical protein KDI31_12225 [Pseudomonadales bacterium]|nr:hypothetical protein [Pseudomonadales bacterium]
MKATASLFRWVFVPGGFIAAVVLTLLLAASPARACRCAQQDLADYFHAAREVVMTRLTHWDPVADGTGQLTLHMELVAPAYRTTRDPVPDTGDRIAYRTADNSAACGLPASPGAVYLLFAQSDGSDRENAPLQVNGCDGSRIILPVDGSEPGGFQDVPPRFVVQQLNGLAGLALLRNIALHHPNPADIGNSSLIGLLDIAGFSHAGHALLYEMPSTARGTPVRVSGYADLETREVSYETPAAVVFAQINGWYRLRLADGGFGWLPPDFAGTYFPYAELPIRRLAYLPLPWHGFLWPEAGAGLPIREAIPTDRREQAIEVLESTRIADSLWFRIRILKEDPCEGGTTGSGVTGWIPAYREDGQPSLWYYSRGC